jgi:hypothetical protein
MTGYMAAHKLGPMNLTSVSADRDAGFECAKRKPTYPQ